MAYTTAALLKQYLGVTTSGDDTLLTSLIAAAQKKIETDRGYAFEASADTTRYFTVGKDTDGKTLYFDMWCASITTVKTNADDGSGGTTIASTEYITTPRNIGPYSNIKLLGSSSNSWTYTTDPEMGVTVAGRWAWSITAPDDIEQACTRLAAYYYRQKDAGVFDTTAIPDMGIIQIPQGIPKDVRDLLDHYPKGFGG